MNTTHLTLAPPAPASTAASPESPAAARGAAPPPAVAASAPHHDNGDGLRLPAQIGAAVPPPPDDDNGGGAAAVDPVGAAADAAVGAAPWSPAAAFLSAFTTASAAPSAIDSIPGYVLGATIAHGSFSTIKEATSPSGGAVAVKILRHSAFAALPPAERAKQRARLSREARIWVALSHENILPLFDSHRTAEATYLITLYCPAGSLLDILRRDGRPALEQTDVGYMFRQIVKALQYLHETVRLVHGDVKLENVLVDECGVCRLADFGLARRIRGDAPGSSSASEDDAEQAAGKAAARGKPLSVHLSLLRHGPHARHRKSEPAAGDAPAELVFLPGSLPYAAPELLPPARGGAYRRPAAHPAQDMWALGVLLYTLLTGALPFRDAFELRLQMKILRGTFEMPPAIGQHAESVLRGCLRRAAGERWTVAQVDNAAWGVGYGEVALDPVLREEQRSQSQEHLEDARGLAPPPPPPAWGAGGLSHSRSRSRSRSPSLAPCTPGDEDDGAGAGYFARAGAVVVAGEEGVEWADGARGRADAPRAYGAGRDKSQSRTRSWSLGDLAGQDG